MYLNFLHYICHNNNLITKTETMNQKDYNQLSEKTLSYNFYVSEQKEKNLLHAILGEMTEAVELLENYDGTKTYDSVNVFEELGDLAWYLSIIQREFKFEYDWNSMKDLPVFKDKLSAAISLIKRCNSLLDYHKKLVFYGKSLDNSQYLQMALSIAYNFLYFVKEEGFNIEDINEKNIAKLKARYGDKFTLDKALNRDLEKERTILENN